MVSSPPRPHRGRPGRHRRHHSSWATDHRDDAEHSRRLTVLVPSLHRHAPADYIATSGALSFAPGTTIAVFKVPVVGDNLAKRDEVFWIAISQGSWATVAAASQGTIIDDV